MTEEKVYTSDTKIYSAALTIKQYCLSHPECHKCPLHNEEDRGCTAYNRLPYDWRLNDGERDTEDMPGSRRSDV